MYMLFTTCIAAGRKAVYISMEAYYSVILYNLQTEKLTVNLYKRQKKTVSLLNITK